MAACTGVQIKVTDTKGRCLHITEPIKAGALVAEEEPLSFVVLEQVRLPFLPFLPCLSFLFVLLCLFGPPFPPSFFELSPSPP
jgi:hypothetical protein